MHDPEVLEEFKVEADEMLNESEEFLLNLEKGEDFTENFNGIFRSFHSLKGAAGMFEIDSLQNFMHTIESQFESLREIGTFSQHQIDYFLQAIDSARKILENDEPTLDTNSFEQEVSEPKTTQVKDDAKVEKVDEPSKVSEKIHKKVEKRLLDEKEKGKGLIYVVDDEIFICEQLQDILVEFGFKAITFTNPLELIEKTKEEEPDLICTDLKMPEMSGMQLLKKIRELKLDTPVIFVTGFVDNKLLIEGMDLGASGFLEKPFEEHQVVSLADQAVKRSQTKKLLNRSLSYILYQFNDLDNYLEKEGKKALRKNLKEELERLLKLKKEIL